MPEPLSACKAIRRQMDEEGEDLDLIQRVVDECKYYTKKCGHGSATAEMLHIRDAYGSDWSSGLAHYKRNTSEVPEICRPPLKCADQKDCPSFLQCDQGACQ